jgi:hypothetical protein
VFLRVQETAEKSQGRLFLLLSPGRCGSRSAALLLYLQLPTTTRVLHEAGQWNLEWPHGRNEKADAEKSARLVRIHLAFVKPVLDSGRDVVLVGFPYIMHIQAIQEYFQDYMVTVVTQNRTKAKLKDSYCTVIESDSNRFEPWKLPQYPDKPVGQSTRQWVAMFINVLVGAMEPLRVSGLYHTMDFDIFTDGDRQTAFLRYFEPTWQGRPCLLALHELTFVYVPVARAKQGGINHYLRSADVGEADPGFLRLRTAWQEDGSFEDLEPPPVTPKNSSHLSQVRCAVYWEASQCLPVSTPVQGKAPSRSSCREQRREHRKPEETSVQVITDCTPAAEEFANFHSETEVHNQASTVSPYLNFLLSKKKLYPCGIRQYFADNKGASILGLLLPRRGAIKVELKLLLLVVTSSTLEGGVLTVSRLAPKTFSRRVSIGHIETPMVICIAFCGVFFEAATFSPLRTEPFASPTSRIPALIVTYPTFESTLMSLRHHCVCPTLRVVGIPSGRGSGYFQPTPICLQWRLKLRMAVTSRN